MRPMCSSDSRCLYVTYLESKDRCSITKPKLGGKIRVSKNILADDHRYSHGVPKSLSETTILREKEILGLANDTLNLHVGHRVLLLWILTLDCRVSILTVTSNDP